MELALGHGDLMLDVFGAVMAGGEPSQEWHVALEGIETEQATHKEKTACLSHVSNTYLHTQCREML